MLYSCFILRNFGEEFDKFSVMQRVTHAKSILQRNEKVVTCYLLLEVFKHQFNVFTSSLSDSIAMTSLIDSSSLDLSSDML